MVKETVLKAHLAAKMATLVLSQLLDSVRASSNLVGVEKVFYNFYTSQEFVASPTE